MSEAIIKGLEKSLYNIRQLYDENGSGEDRGFVKGKVAGLNVAINLLKEAGKVLNMKLVYGFVPIHGSIDAIITQKSNELAKRIVLRTNQTMMLENQATGKENIERAIDELADDIKQQMTRSLWD